MKVTVGGYVLGGMAAAASRSMYRPEDQVWIVLMGATLVLFGLVMAAINRKTQSLVMIQALIGLAAIGVSGLFAHDQVARIGFAAILGAALADPAMHFRRRVVFCLSILTLVEGWVLVAGSGVTSSAQRLVALPIAIACLAPMMIALAYRRQLDELVAQLQEAATTDPLTALVNRRGLAQWAPMLFSEAARSGRSLAVLVADIDHFKRYNDTHGHQRGDEVLRTVAHLMRSSVRPTDLVARLGGEELCIVTVLSDSMDVAALAERVRKNVEHGSDSVTVSLGAVAGTPQDGTSVEDQLWELIEAADVLMYEAKAAGRNTVRTLTRRAPAAAPSL